MIENFDLNNLEPLKEAARRDDACTRQFVPSDIRMMLGEIERLRAEIERLRGHLTSIRHAHDGNPSDECAMLPEIDYARLIMSGMRAEAREALDGKTESLFAE